VSRLTLSFKGKVLKVYPVLPGEMFIGHDAGCKIHIDSLAVEPRHARLFTEDNVTVLEDLGSEGGTFVNQAPVEKHTLQHNDTVRVGKHTLTFSFQEHVELQPEPEVPTVAPAIEEPGDAPQDVRPAWLQIMSGQNLGKTISLNRSMTNLGKPGVANAVIARRQDGYFLSHLEGKQPPLVGDKPIGDETVKLDDGDVIQIGNIKMQFYFE
jgi:pSer/pThr/pTyr-binding forkhead associated (FHA) protein